MHNVNNASLKHNEGNRAGCTECRLVGGVGLIGASTYVFFNARKSTTKVNKGFAVILGGALFGVGVARLLNFPRPRQ